MPGVHKTAVDLQREPLCPKCHVELFKGLAKYATQATACPSCGVVVYVERFTMYHTYTLGESNDQ